MPKPHTAVLTVICGIALASCDSSDKTNSGAASDAANTMSGVTTSHLLPISRPLTPSTSDAANSSQSTTPNGASVPSISAVLTVTSTADIDAGQAPLTIQFGATTRVGSLNLPLTYAWNFGDQSTGSGAAVQHTFASPGIYTVVVVVLDGQTSSTSAPMTVTVSASSVAPAVPAVPAVPPAPSAPAAPAAPAPPVAPAVPAPRYSSSLFYVSRAVSPGQTILFQGTGLGGVAQATVAQVVDSATPDPTKASYNFPATTDLSASTVVPILQSTNTSAKITVPGTLTPGVYAIQYQAPTAATAPDPSTLIHAVVNLPWIQWWMGRSTLPGSSGSAAYPGQEIDVFGRNFGSMPKVWVSSNGSFSPLTVLQSNPYRVSAVLPNSVPAGTYQLWIHNGHGGQYGFSEPTTITVSALPAPWPTTQFNVTQFGAKGNGIADDTTAITAALKAAGASGQNGGVVYLPAGQYLISGKLRVPANTIVAGASTATTTIKTASLPVSNGSFQSLFEGSSHFIIQDLTITSGAADMAITCPASQGMYNFYGIQEPLASGAQCRDVTLQRLSVSHTTLQPAQSNGLWIGGRTLNFQGTDIRILNSVVSSQNNVTLFLSEPTNSTIVGNTFLDGRHSYIEIVDSESTIIQGNTISATDPTGNCVGNQGQIHHVYVAQNDIHDCQGTYGEAFSEDTPYYPYWLGHPTAISSATGSLSFAASFSGPYSNLPTDGGTNLANGYIAVVVGGTGLGQMKRIAANSNTSISVESPWLVPLDTTSVIDIQVDKSQNVFFQNRFSNTSVGVQLYSQAYENVIDGNTGSNMGGSYCVANDIPAQASAGGPLVRRFEYCYYNEWLNNTFNGNLPDSNMNRRNQMSYPNAFLGQTGNTSDFTGSAASVMPRDPLVMFIGNSFRGNAVGHNNTIGFVFRGSHPQVAPSSLDELLSLDLMIEQNNVQNCQPPAGSSISSLVGVDIYPGSNNTFASNNTISGCQTPIWNSSKP
jgi:parallel beta-helix repeat protein